MFAIKGLKLEVGAKFHGEWAHIATTHIFSGILSSVSFADKFRTTDGTFGTLLIEEINNTCTKRELLFTFQLIPPKVSQCPLNREPLASLHKSCQSNGMRAIHSNPL